MTRLLLKFFISFLLLLGGLTGCVSLGHINDFSSSALESLQKFEEIDYNFKQDCLDKCLQHNISNLIVDHPDCNCQANEKADSITTIIYTALKGYLGGLNNLSKNSLTDYKLDGFSASLAKLEMGSIKFEKSQVEAYSNISAILLSAFTDKYRRHKIKEYLIAGDEPLNVLIRFMDFNLSENLNGKLNVQKELIKDNYFDLTKDQTLSTYEKRKAVEAYYQQNYKIERRQKELSTYSKSLRKIATAHQNLVGNIDRIKDDEIKLQLTRYAGDIRDLITAFNKIKK